MNEDAERFAEPSELPERYLAIFQHIPRTAGTSIVGLLTAESLKHGRFSLWNVRRRYLATRATNPELRPAIVEIGHTNLCHLIRRKQWPVLAENQVKRCILFVFVRNPWRRLVSVYELLTRLGQHRLDKCVLPYLQSFASFSEHVCSDQWNGDGNSKQFDSGLQRFGAWMAQPQSRWLDAIGEASIEPNLLIGRFESLRHDLDEIFDAIGIEIGSPLPRLQADWVRRDRTPPPPYHTYWNPKAIRSAEEYYAADIERFGYTFDGDE